MKSFIKSAVMITAMSFGSAYGAKKIDCNKHKVYCAIKKLNKSMNSKKAFKYSNAIYKHSKRYGVDPLRLVAIAQQESSFRNVVLKKNRKVCSYPKRCTGTDIIEATDVGFYQFHIKTIQRRNLDVYKVLNDFDYATRHAAWILNGKMNMCKKKYPKTSWACYHSATPKHHYKYVKTINKYYNQIKGDK